MNRLACWTGLVLAVAAGRPAMANTNATILVASSGGAFKDLVVQRVVNYANEKRWPVETVALGALTPATATNRTAVVIANSVWAWRPAWRVRRFLRRLTEEQRGRVILVSTVQGEDWQYKDPRVHAITAASKPDRVEKVVRFVTGELDKLVAGTPAPRPSSPAAVSGEGK
jgi:hypothetical protein